MSHEYVFSSLSRIAPLSEISFEVVPLDRGAWASGDYVVGEVELARGPLARAELINGRMAEVAPGDLVVGAFGNRAATLEAVGTWEAIDDSLRFQALTSAGLFGRATSWSAHLRRMVTLVYCGHVLVNGEKQNMVNFVESAPACELSAPVVMVIGTSMAAGKTTAAKILIRLLKEENRRVVGAKLTGAARYRDILSMADAGADAVFDFVDVGLPSSICPVEEFHPRIRGLLHKIAAVDPEVVVAEAGASPLEPYNGTAAIEELAGQVRCTILCASDPYAAFGVMEAFETLPDLITGIGASTSAAIELIEKLTAVPAVNLLKPEARPALRRLLDEKLGLAAKG